MGNKGMHMVTWILLIVGGLNWLLYALGWDIATWFNNDANGFMMVIYWLVGLSALYELFTHKGRCKDCENKASAPMGM